MATAKRKRYVQVAGTPQYAQWRHRNDLINNPLSGTATFGTFPAIEDPSAPFVGGPIYLRFGEHFGPKRGWGLEHIWKTRFQTIGDLPSATKAVTDLINQILIHGTSIYYEANLGTAGKRSTIFRGSTGNVIVEERFDGLNKVFYGIVTAFPANRVHGYIIGNLE